VKYFKKDPGEVLDYQVDWTTWLNSDTIATSTWTVPTGITKNSDTNTSTTATIWLSGGTVSTTYTLTNVITTAGGRTAERSIVISVQSR